MTEKIWEGKTVDAAIDNALQELKCTRAEVEIEILQEPGKGIFGISKLAKIKVASHPGAVVATHGEDKDLSVAVVRGQEALEKILALMGIKEYTIQSRSEEENIILAIQCEAEEGLLIGRHGATREALQYIVDRISSNAQPEMERKRYIIDIGGYLARHKEGLEKIALSAAKKVKEEKREEALEAMSAYDRRIIHLLLKEDQAIKTFSQGEGNLRHIVIAPKD